MKEENFWWKIEDALNYYGVLDRAKTQWESVLDEKEYEEAVKLLGETAAKKHRKGEYDKLTIPMEYSRFGLDWLDYYKGVYHPGIDFNFGDTPEADCGKHVFVMADGIVTYRAYARGWGWHMYVMHEINHKEMGKFKCWSHYAHLKELPKVGTGEEVKSGQKIALCGNTGGTYTCHLHFEIRQRPLGVNYYPQGESKYSVQRKFYDPHKVLVF